MLAKLTSKNQLTLPKAALEPLGPVEYFEIETRAGQLVLTPVRLQRADAVRAKLAQLKLTEADVADARAWARGGVHETRATYRSRNQARPRPRKPAG